MKVGKKYKKLRGEGYKKSRHWLLQFQWQTRKTDGENANN